ncbi:DNA-3-methyladenine glycosylase 2 family protein [Pseudothauera nasutitermitis]|uniref:DNA-3-methyladenine glycosylase 2 family protein n=1 Tax=Pseudothauera nasutitermitis TaxID=2565930 RepID=UPI001B3B2721|nr:AlkA N-terminal domain-containing protein [Pseudothauera nasutitermitis]
MQNDRDCARYAAFKAKDARFDGHFFVGVSSTGIYCRPVCRARLPRPENCTFYASAAAAEQAGFRPCLLCRPELAPGNAPVDASASLARRAARLLEDHCGSEHSVEELAHRLGCTDRHLRRVFLNEYDVSPIQYLQTCRLLLAKSLLTDTGLSVIDVAMAAGFGSLRRFNALFKKQYRLTPTALRRETARHGERGTGITLTLGYRPPYPWQQMLDFLAGRAIPGVELVRDGEYLRTVRFATEARQPVCGWIRVGHLVHKRALSVTVDAALLPVLSLVLARVRHLFDLCCDPDTVYAALAPMNAIRPGLCVHGTRLPGCFDAFEMAVRAILGQQITVKAARTLAGRIVQAHGTPLATAIEGLTHVFPSPETIAALDGPIGEHLGPLGITGARARSIQALACALAAGEIDFGHGSPPQAQIGKLMEMPGIGEWTAQYLAMRGMGWPDAFPHTDYGVKKALAPRSPAQILALAESWRPWRGYATVNLWNSL